MKDGSAAGNGLEGLEIPESVKSLAELFERQEKTKFALTGPDKLFADEAALTAATKLSIAARLESPKAKELESFYGISLKKQLESVTAEADFLRALIRSELLTELLELFELTRESMPQSFREFVQGRKLLTKYLPAPETATALKAVKEYNLLNDKVVYAIVGNFFSHREIDGQMCLDFAVNEANKKATPVPIYITLAYENGGSGLDKRINAFDESVFNAVCTFSYYGKMTFTAVELWRLMNGYHGNLKKNPTKKQMEKIVISLKKLKRINLVMDISEELKAGYFTIDDERVVNGKADVFFLPVESCTLKTENNKIVAGYELLKEPFFFTYHRAKKHIITVPYDLLNTGTGITGYYAEFRDFMLKRIASMKAGVFHGRHINLTGSDSIYANTGVPLPEDRINRDDYALQRDYKAAVRREAASDRKTIEAILESWKDKKFVKGFSVERGTDNQFTGVRIRL